MLNLIEALLKSKQQQQPQVAPQDPQDVLAAQTVAAPNPLEANPQLEAAVAPNDYPINPLVAAIQQHLGFMNLVRNRRNQKQLSVQALDQ